MLLDYTKHPFFPKSKEDFLNRARNLKKYSKLIMKHIMPIVLSCEFQNAVRVAFVAFKLIKRLITVILKQLVEPNRQYDLDACVKRLIDYSCSLAEVLRLLNYIHKHYEMDNKILSPYVNYLHKVDMITCYLLANVLKKEVEDYCDNYSPVLLPIKRLRCISCFQYVSFYGCGCTKWTMKPVVTFATTIRLLDFSDDGPASFLYKTETMDWEHLCYPITYEFCSVDKFIKFNHYFNRSTDFGGNLGSIKLSWAPIGYFDDMNARTALCALIERRSKFIKFNSMLTRYNSIPKIFVKNGNEDQMHEIGKNELLLIVDSLDNIDVESENEMDWEFGSN